MPSLSDFIPLSLRATPLVAALLLAACGGGGGGAASAPGGGGGGAAGGGAPPPPQVGVIEVDPKPVVLQNELPGRVEALRTAQVRARVNGVVLKRLFREGSDVKAGQALYQIDPAPYKATLDSALASVQRAEATLAQAKAQADRYKPLVEANAISKQDYVNAVAAQKTAEADLASGRAAVQTARINLGYAQVTAPIAGRIGRSMVTEGALVSATEATQLATIQQVENVYVNFTQSATDVLRLRKALAANQLRSAGPGAAEVQVVLEDGSTMPKPGKLLFSDLSVDPSSGQITLRAELPNPDSLLLPGQYVRVRIAQVELPEGVLLPQQAATRTNQGDTVLVVGEGNKPVRRPVKINGSKDGQWIVTEGLKPGERVIVDGFQKMMVPGAPVTPVPWQKPGAGGTAAGASQGAASAPAAGGASAPAAAAASSASAPASAARQ